LFYFVKV